MTKTIDILDQARTALLHGEPHQRFNMAAIITDHLAQLRAADEPVERQLCIQCTGWLDEHRHWCPSLRTNASETQDLK